MLKFALGLDFSMKEIQACLSVIDQLQRVTVKASKKFQNNPKGFEALVLWINKNHKFKEIPLVICSEATGVYHEFCSIYLHKKGYYISVILPNKSKKYLQASGLKTKNDKIDAQGLAQMAAEKALPAWKPMDEFFYQLRTMTRQYESYQSLITQIQNQLHALRHSGYPSKIVEKNLSKTLKNIKKQADLLKIDIQNQLLSHNQYGPKAEKLNKIKGVGILTIATIIAETGGFEQFSNTKQLVNYSGYDVVENQSGKHTGKTRISKKGNSHIRRALFMPAFNVVRFKVDVFEDLYKRTFEKHFIKMKSYVAVQRKLLIIMYLLWKKDEEFKIGFISHTNAKNESRLEQSLAYTG